MSGVSITEGGPNIDVAAVLAGGEHLQTRIAQLKAAHDKANEWLALAEAAETRAEQIIASAKAQASEIIAAAQAESEKLIADAMARRKTFDDRLAAIKASLAERVATVAKSIA